MTCSIEIFLTRWLNTAKDYLQQNFGHDILIQTIYDPTKKLDGTGIINVAKKIFNFLLLHDHIFHFCAIMIHDHDRDILQLILPIQVIDNKSFWDCHLCRQIVILQECAQINFLTTKSSIFASSQT